MNRNLIFLVDNVPAAHGRIATLSLLSVLGRRGSLLQVAFTSLRLVSGGDGRLLAGGWSKKKGAKKADAFVVAEVNPSERLVTFKAAKVGHRCTCM